MHALELIISFVLLNILVMQLEIIAHTCVQSNENSLQQFCLLVEQHNKQQCATVL